MARGMTRRWGDPLRDLTGPLGAHVTGHRRGGTGVRRIPWSGRCPPGHHIITVGSVKNRSTGVSKHPLAPRLASLALGAACVLAGLDAALLRLGLPAPVTSARLADLHGPLMLVGFLGTVIALERCVALGRTWGWLAPFGNALGCLALLAGAPTPAAGVLLVTAQAALVGVYVAVHRRAPSTAVDVEAMGALALLLGTLLWLRGLPVPQVVALWLLFPVLTIVGERLELARVAFLGPRVEPAVEALAALALLGACLVPVAPSARFLLGPALAALTAVMVRHDVARRTVHAHGGTRFAAVSMLAGYAWLGLSGLTWTLLGAHGDAYDVVVHTVTLGFAFSMVLAHAPTIVPAIVRRPLPYHPAMWAAFALLHTGLLVRVVGLAEGAAGAWQAGGATGVGGVLVFLAVTVALTLTGPRRAQAARSARPHRPGPTDAGRRRSPTSVVVPTQAGTHPPAAPSQTADGVAARPADAPASPAPTASSTTASLASTASSTTGSSTTDRPRP